MSADANLEFNREFENLTWSGTNASTEVATMDCNRGKNRYFEILAYDHSRFELKDTKNEPCSSYINANYIPVSSQ